MTWLSNNLAGSYKRAVGMGIQISVGNLGNHSSLLSPSPKLMTDFFPAGAMASNFYRSADSPRYKLGHGLEIGFISLGLIAIVIQIWNYRRINAKRAAQIERLEHNGYTPEELSDLGDKAMTFRYTL